MEAAPVDPKLPTLMYFQGAGRADATRAACFLSGLKYNDVRLSQEEFGAKKASGELPLGSVPVWIEDGVKYVQSNTILRMVCQRGGMYSTDPAEAWAIDSYLEAVEDNAGKFQPMLFTVLFGPGASGVTEEVLESAKGFFGKLSELIEKRMNAHGGKYLVGNRVTAADLKLATGFYGTLYNEHFPCTPEQREAMKSAVHQYPKAKQFFEVTVPEFLGAYLAQRPAGPF